MSTNLTEPTEAAPLDRHPIWGLPRVLICDGQRFTYDAYLDCWTNGLGVEWTGWTILHAMSHDMRVEVAR